MKRKIHFGLIGLSACFFVYLLIMNIIKISNMFTAPDTFSLVPVLFSVIILVVLLCHGGVVVLIMDRKEMNHFIEDEERWWEKWDRV